LALFTFGLPIQPLDLFCNSRMSPLKFSNSGDGGAWSNDFVGVRLIATPGAPGVARYGYMPFKRNISQEEKIKIEYNAANCANNIEVEILFYGRVYAGSKVVGNKVVQ